MDTMISSNAGFTASIKSALAVLAASLAACAPLNESQCRSADWYDLGYRDGDSYGLRPQIDQYAYRCKAYGVEASEPRYMAGWVDGYREFTKRAMGSDCCAP